MSETPLTDAVKAPIQAQYDAGNLTYESMLFQMVGALSVHARKQETALSAAEHRAEAMGRDAARYRWLRTQHEGKAPLEMDAEDMPMPQEVNALAFTVFYPDPTGDESLVVVPMGDLDETIDAAIASGEKG